MLDDWREDGREEMAPIVTIYMEDILNNKGMERNTTPKRLSSPPRILVG